MKTTITDIHLYDAKAGERRPNCRWLGRNSCESGGPLIGNVYPTPDQGTENTRTLKTTCQQDEEFLKKLMEMVGLTATYSILRHNCRAFSQMMYDEASDLYKQIPPTLRKPGECECPKCPKGEKK